MPKGFTFFLLKFKKLLCFRLGESLFLSVMASGRSIHRLQIWFNALFVCINFPVSMRLHCCLGFESAPSDQSYYYFIKFIYFSLQHLANRLTSFSRSSLILLSASNLHRTDSFGIVTDFAFCVILILQLLASI